MKKSGKIILLALLAFSATACIKEGYNSENCPGEFTFIPQYPNGEMPNPEGSKTFITMPDGRKVPVIIGEGKPLDLEDGTYTITTTTGATDNVEINKNIVTIGTNPDGSFKEPEDFAGGYIDFTVGSGSGSGGDNKNHTISMIPQTRPLNIVVKFTGNNVSLVKGIAGTISDIAFSRDLNNGFVPLDGQPRHPAFKSGSVSYGFDKAANQSFLSETHRLLGIDGDNEQYLTLDILFDQDVTKQYDFNVASAMDGFHITEVDKTWTIEITINLGADFSATIEDWKAGPDIWMDAEY